MFSSRAHQFPKRFSKKLGGGAELRFGPGILGRVNTPERSLDSWGEPLAEVGEVKTTSALVKVGLRELPREGRSAGTCRGRTRTSTRGEKNNTSSNNSSNRATNDERSVESNCECGTCYGAFDGLWQPASCSRSELSCTVRLCQDGRFGHL